MKQIRYFTVSLMLSVVLLAPLFTQASGLAGINISPATGSYKVGQTFNVAISIDPAGDKIDTVRAKLTFSPEFLEIKNFSLSPVFSFQAGSNGFDNSAGTLSWGAGVPGGITANNNFGTITFSVKKPGNAQVSVSQDSLVLSSGDNKFSGQISSAAFTLLPAVSAPVKNIPVNNAQVQSPVVEQPAQEQPETAIPNDNTVETQIVSQPSRSFAASLIGSLSMMATMKAGALLLSVLILLLLAAALYRTRDDVMLFFKRINNKRIK